MSYIREDQFIIHAAVDGVNPPSIHSWQSKEGGEVQADSVVTHPGGMQTSVALGGPSKRTDCTVKRMFTSDLVSFVPQWEAACGNSRGWVSWTPLDGNSNPLANSTTTIYGVLKEVQVPAYNANTAAEATLGLVFSCDQ